MTVDHIKLIEEIDTVNSMNQNMNEIHSELNKLLSASVEHVINEDYIIGNTKGKFFRNNERTLYIPSRLLFRKCRWKTFKKTYGIARIDDPTSITDLPYEIIMKRKMDDWVYFSMTYINEETVFYSYKELSNAIVLAVKNRLNLLLRHLPFVYEVYTSDEGFVVRLVKVHASENSESSELPRFMKTKVKRNLFLDIYSKVKHMFK